MTRDCIGTLFLDSGGFSLYQKHKDDREWFAGDEFREYMDGYAEFVRSNRDGIDYYSNVDVLYDPERTWEAQRYLEDVHDLRPVPVVHYGTGTSWLQRYIDDGHDLISLGGGANIRRKLYFKWADHIFDYVCRGRKRIPTIRLHGFAMTSWNVITRYPWWSVDSASWVKAGGFGRIFIPNVSWRIRNPA